MGKKSEKGHLLRLEYSRIPRSAVKLNSQTNNQVFALLDEIKLCKYQDEKMRDRSSAKSYSVCLKTQDYSRPFSYY